MTISNIMGIDARCNHLIQSIKHKDDARLFVVRICNYELLAVLLSATELEKLMSEIDALILSLLHQLGYTNTSEVIRERNHIAFIVCQLKLHSMHELAYLIYKTIQLHSTAIHQFTALKCKMSSACIADLNPLADLLCTLIYQEASSYYVDFIPDIRSQVQAAYTKLKVFQNALQNQTISFAYQPIIERATGDIQYYECLLRIPNAQSDIVSIGPFISLAEEMGLNNVIDRTVLQMTVNELQAAQNVSLSVNISNAGITDPNLLRIAQELLSDRSIAKRLIIEITETSMNMDFDYTKHFVEMLRALGCKIALDDFGTGFTSFKQLQNLPIDIIKIDGSFIRDITNNQRNQHLVLALIDIAEQLGAKTVAEFVETGEIAKFLLDAKIDYMQGNFFSPALNYRSWNKN